MSYVHYYYIWIYCNYNLVCILKSSHNYIYFVVKILTINNELNHMTITSFGTITNKTYHNNIYVVTITRD